MIRPTDKFFDKFVEGKFKEINPDNWYQKYVLWLIDSKYNSYKKLNMFISDQVEEMPIPILDLIKKKKFIDKNPDVTMINILRYVLTEYKYKTDKEQFGYDEKWESVKETVSSKFGDCESLNSLIHAIALICGTIPEICLWSVIGDATDGKTTFGHYWLMYMSPKTGKFYSIDATVYPDLTSIDDGRFPFSMGKPYKKIWYMFNNLRCYKYD